MEYQLLNYDDVKKNKDLVYAGYSSNDRTKQGIKKLIEATKEKEKECGIKCYPVILDSYGFGLYIYADKKYNDYSELNRLKNYLEDNINPKIKELEKWLEEKQKTQQKIQDLEKSLKGEN